MPSRPSPARKIGTIYARFSTRFQHSVEDQIRTCKEWADAESSNSSWINGCVTPF